jgi:hypothetical protein
MKKKSNKFGNDDKKKFDPFTLITNNWKIILFIIVIVFAFKMISNFLKDPLHFLWDIADWFAHMAEEALAPCSSCKPDPKVPGQTSKDVCPPNGIPFLNLKCFAGVGAVAWFLNTLLGIFGTGLGFIFSNLRSKIAEKWKANTGKEGKDLVKESKARYDDAKEKWDKLTDDEKTKFKNDFIKNKNDEIDNSTKTPDEKAAELEKLDAQAKLPPDQVFVQVNIQNVTNNVVTEATPPNPSAQVEADVRAAGDAAASSARSRIAEETTEQDRAAAEDLMDSEEGRRAADDTIEAERGIFAE